MEVLTISISHLPKKEMLILEADSMMTRYGSLPVLLLISRRPEITPF